MAKTKKSKWIGQAIKRPGALRERLQELGLAKPEGRLPLEALKKAATGAFGPQTARRARLALTLRRLGKKQRKGG